MNKRSFRVRWCLIVLGVAAAGKVLAQTPAIQGGQSANNTGSIVSSPSGWAFHVNSTLTVTRLGVWLPDWLTDLNLPSPFLSGQPLFVGLMPSVYSNIPFVQALVTFVTATRGASIAGGAYWYVPVNPFQLTAGSDYAIFSALTAGSTWGIGTSFDLKSFVNDPRITPFASLAANGQASGNPLMYNTGPYLNYNGIPAGPNFIALTVTPEPATVVLLATGLILIAWLGRWRQGDNEQSPES